MSVKLLDFVPPSGRYPEYHFGEHFQDKLWVEFEDSNDQIWLGCFTHKPYEKAFDKILTNDDGKFALVISSGTGYLIDIEKRSLIYQSEEYPPIESAICTNNPDYFLAGTFHSILILNRNGLIKEIISEFTVDGIYFTGQVEHIATGDLYSYIYGDINVGFELDLFTFSLSVNATIKVNRLGPLEYIVVKDSRENQTKPANFLSRLLKYFLG